MALFHRRWKDSRRPRYPTAQRVLKVTSVSLEDVVGVLLSVKISYLMEQPVIIQVIVYLCPALLIPLQE